MNKKHLRRLGMVAKYLGLGLLAWAIVPVIVGPLLPILFYKDGIISLTEFLASSSLLLIIHTFIMGMLIKLLLSLKHVFQISLLTNTFLTLECLILICALLLTPLGCRQFTPEKQCGYNVASPGMEVLQWLMWRIWAIAPLIYAGNLYLSHKLIRRLVK